MIKTTLFRRLSTLHLLQVLKALLLLAQKKLRTTPQLASSFLPKKLKGSRWAFHLSLHLRRDLPEALVHLSPLLVSRLLEAISGKNCHQRLAIIILALEL